MTEQELYKRAIDKWGALSQMEMAVEEFAEAIVAIKHYVRHNRPANRPDLIDELVDAEIMATQMKMIFGGEEWDRIHQEKLARLERKLK